MSNRDPLVERAARFLTNAPGDMGAKMAFLKHKGLTDTQAMEALNLASVGALVDSALEA